MQRGNTDEQLNVGLSLINDALHRLETFQLIQDTEIDLHNDKAMKEWIQFSKADLLDECNVYLSKVCYFLF